MVEDNGVESRFDIDWESASEDEYADLYGSLSRVLGRSPTLKDIMELPHGPSFGTLTRIWGSPDAFLDWGAEQKLNSSAEATRQERMAPDDSMDDQTTEHYQQPLGTLESAVQEHAEETCASQASGMQTFEAVRAFAFELRYKREQTRLGKITRKVWKAAGGPPISTVREVFNNPDYSTCWEAIEADYQLNREPWLEEVRRGTSVVPARSGNTEPLALIADTMTPEQIAEVRAKIDEQGYGALVTREGTYRPESSSGAPDGEIDSVERTMRGMGLSNADSQTANTPQRTTTQMGVGRVSAPIETPADDQGPKSTVPGMGELLGESTAIQDAYNAQAGMPEPGAVPDKTADVQPLKSTIPGLGELSAQDDAAYEPQSPDESRIALGELAKQATTHDEETSPNKLKAMMLAGGMNEEQVHDVESTVIGSEEVEGPEAPRATTINKMAGMLSVAGAKTISDEEPRRQQSPSTEFFSVDKHIGAKGAVEDEGLPPLPGEKTRIGGSGSTEVSGLISADVIAPPSRTDRHEHSVTSLFDTSDKEYTLPGTEETSPGERLRPMPLAQISTSDIEEITDPTVPQRPVAEAKASESRPQQIKVAGVDAIMSSPVPKQAPSSEEEVTKARIIARKDKQGYVRDYDSRTPTPTPTPAGEISGKRLEDINSELAQQAKDSKGYDPATARQARNKKIMVGAGIGATALALAGVLGVALAPNQTAQEKQYAGKAAAAEMQKSHKADGGTIVDALQRAVAALSGQKQDPPALPSDMPPNAPEKKPLPEDSSPATQPTYDGKQAERPASKPAPSAGGGKDWEDKCRNAAFNKAIALVNEDHPTSVVPQYNLGDGKVSRQGVANTAYWNGTREDKKVEDWIGGAGDGKQHDAANAYVQKLTGRPLAHFTRNRAEEFTSEDIDPQKVDPGMVSDCAGKPEEKHGSLGGQDDGKIDTNIALLQLNLYQSWLNGEIHYKDLEALAVQNGFDFSWVAADERMAERAEYLSMLGDNEFVNCLTGTEMRCFDKFHYMHVEGTGLTDEQIMQSGINYSMPPMTRAQAEQRYQLLLARRVAEKAYADSLEDLTELAVLENGEESGDGDGEDKDLPLPLSVGIILPALRKPRREEEDEDATSVIVRDVVLSETQYLPHDPAVSQETEGVVIYDLMDRLKTKAYAEGVDVDISDIEGNAVQYTATAPSEIDVDFSEFEVAAAEGTKITASGQDAKTYGPEAAVAVEQKATPLQETPVTEIDSLIENALVETAYAAPVAETAEDDDGWNLSSIDVSNYKPAERLPTCTDAQARAVAGLVEQGMTLRETNAILGTYVAKADLADLMNYVREDREADDFVERIELDRMKNEFVLEGKTEAQQNTVAQTGILPVQENMWSVYAANTAELMHDMALLGKNADYINWIAAQHGINIKVTDADVDKAVREVRLTKLAAGEITNNSAKEAEESAAGLETILPWEFAYARLLSSFEQERQMYADTGFVSANALPENNEAVQMTDEEHKQTSPDVESLAWETASWELKHQSIVDYFEAGAAAENMKKAAHLYSQEKAPEPLMRLASMELSVEELAQMDAKPETAADASVNDKYDAFVRKWADILSAEERSSRDALQAAEQESRATDMRQIAFGSVGYTELLNAFENERNEQDVLTGNHRMYTTENADIFVFDMTRSGKRIDEINKLAYNLGIDVKVDSENLPEMFREGGLRKANLGYAICSDAEKQEIRLDIEKMKHGNGVFSAKELDDLFVDELQKPAVKQETARPVVEYAFC